MVLSCFDILVQKDDHTISPLKKGILYMIQKFFRLFKSPLVLLLGMALFLGGCGGCDGGGDADRDGDGGTFDRACG